VLRGLVEEVLQLQEAERLGITVQDQEIDQALANIAERNNMEVPAMRRLLADTEIDFIPEAKSTNSAATSKPRRAG
jgi:parvulin-like peptidyl-prolyl isomerase